ncbi:MAG: type II toxin-antitoxin system PemK/MazF family toxin [Acidimicrobiales bacterium]
MWWAELPEVGRRPVLVLTRDEVVHALAAVLVATVTTRRRDLPTEVALDTDDGMPRACVVSLDNVATERKAHLVERITRLGPDRMADVCRALSYATGC